MTDAVQEDTRGAIEALAADGASVVVCTCSTLAGFAETLSTDSLTVIRIDRPMAREAIRLAEAGSGRISLLAALDSALPPGLELLEEEAAGTSTTIESTLVEEAWVAFEAGDQRGYLGRIAAAIEQAATDGTDVIVLAQASMAGAADQARTEVPVLASPALAVAAALEASGR